MKQLQAEWVEWVQGFDPVLQAHVPPQFPWFRPETQLRAAALLQKLIAEASGEVPTMFCAIQRNVKRGYGCHSHDLACGSPQLLEGRRTAMWSEFRRVVGGWPGQGQPGYWGLRPASVKGSPLLFPVEGEVPSASEPLYSTAVFAQLLQPITRGAGARSARVGERDWGFQSPVVNECRLRLLPITNDTRAITNYCVRYCMREDVENSVEVLGAASAAETWARYRV